MIFVVRKDSLPVLRFPLSASYCQCSTLVFVLILSDEPWKLETNNVPAVIGKHGIQKYFHTVFRLQRVAELCTLTKACGNKTLQIILSSEPYTETYKTSGVFTFHCGARSAAGHTARNGEGNMHCTSIHKRLKPQAGGTLKWIARKKLIMRTTLNCRAFVTTAIGL
jgi:hypothetical protein